MLSVDVNDENCFERLKIHLEGLLRGQKAVILCVGSEKVGGDMLGPLVVIDAALGRQGEVGTIQVYGHGLRPGSATNKNLPCVGDISIIGVVNRKICAFELSMLYTARRAMVDKMSDIISDSVAQAL